jgi:hypothetical protein
MKNKSDLSIDDFCKKHGVTKLKLSQAAGISKQSLHNYQRNAADTEYFVRHSKPAGTFEIIRAEEQVAAGELEAAKGGKQWNRKATSTNNGE